MHGLALVAASGLLIAVASLVAEHRLGACRPQKFQLASPRAQAQKLWGTGCGIYPDQGSNLCPLHWQMDSYPLLYQGSPTL